MRSASCSSTGASTASQRHGSVDVVVVPVGQDDGSHPPTVDRATIVSASCAASNTTTSRSSPATDVVGDFPLAAVEGEDAVGGDQFDRHRDLLTTRRRCAAPRRAPSCGTLPRRHREKSSR
jgi:hypothetical protein